MAKVAEYSATWRRHTLEFEASTASETKDPQYDGVRNWTVNGFQPTEPGHSPVPAIPPHTPTIVSLLLAGSHHFPPSIIPVAV
ncbi:hypothetical protein E2542_SST03856 [Spatholobus suberectus]|nr:hypothetical protein E2542_SST03856 [Spatholobus suberectus]